MPPPNLRLIFWSSVTTFFFFFFFFFWLLRYFKNLRKSRRRSNIIVRPSLLSSTIRNDSVHFFSFHILEHLKFWVVNNFNIKLFCYWSFTCCSSAYHIKFLTQTSIGLASLMDMLPKITLMVEIWVRWGISLFLLNSCQIQIFVQIFW